MSGARWWLAGVFLLLTACGTQEAVAPPSPQEPGAASVGTICGMVIREHPGPKGQMYVAGESGPLWFSSVRDALTYYFLEGATRKILAFYVNDMGQGSWETPPPGSWIRAEQALYVVESRRLSGMGGAELIPFQQREAAERFRAQYGGAIIPFTAITKERVLASSEAATAAH